MFEVAHFYAAFHGLANRFRRPVLRSRQNWTRNSVG